YVHSSFAAVLDYGAYAVELERYAVLQVAIARSGETAFDATRSHPDTGKPVAAYYYWLFPTTMFNVYPWGVSVNVVVPLAVDRTRVSFLPFVWDASRREQGAGGGLDRVEREDEAIVEAVQRGVRSRLYDRGRYSPERERGDEHDHRYDGDMDGEQHLEGHGARARAARGRELAVRRGARRDGRDRNVRPPGRRHVLAGFEDHLRCHHARERSARPRQL